MKLKVFVLILCFFMVSSVSFRSAAQDLSVESLRTQSYVEDISFCGNWKDAGQSIAGLRLEPSRSTITQDAYLIHLDKVDKKGYGGALNLKYFTGLSYDFLRRNLPGKKVSVDLFIPRESVSPNPEVPNRLRVTVKSEKNGSWTEYYNGGEWRRVTKEGIYHFEINIPDKPVKMETGKTFYPDHTALVCIEYFLLEGSTYHPYITLYFTNFQIDGIDLDPASLKWQMMKNGYAIKDEFLPAIPAGSTIINAIGSEENLLCPVPDTQTGNENLFMDTSVFIPKALRSENGALALTVQDKKSSHTVVKKFDSCNAEGKISLAMPLEDGVKNKTINIQMKTLKTHDKSMEPIVLEPLKIRMGRLIPFDDKWKVRDIQGLGGYKYIEIRRDGACNGMAVAALGNNLYQLDATVRLQGGIDWNNPYYRAELMRPFDKDGANMENMHLEVMVSPLTDTTDLWQRPYRARLGLLDVNDKVMFGPNFSLSEGITKTLYLDVSTSNPIARGLTMDGFDEKNVKAILINIEATHARVPARDIKLSFTNLTIRPTKETEVKKPVPIDFSHFKRNPGVWEISKLIKNRGGYVVGINYPFPVVDVPKDVMEVPQVYPTVGKKPNDKIHLGFSGDITKNQAIKDFTKFAENDIELVRIFLMGHLEGVFTWNADGSDIAGFGAGDKNLVKKLAGMRVEKLAAYLNKSSDEVFKTTADGVLLGLEAKVIDDFFGLLDVLETVEKNTGKRVYVILSMYDFMFADAVTREGPGGKYVVGEHVQIATERAAKAKAEVVVWKILKTLSEDRRFHRYVACVKVMNEPANAAALTTKENFTDLVNFVAENLYLFKDAVGPSVPVSVGFESWKDNLQYWTIIKDGIDLMMPHYWESLESYNINKEGLWPLDMPSSEIWEKLGTQPLGRPTGIGEISPGGNLKKNLFDIERAGHDFALAWSYSGHDGHDVKPVMDSIIQYQTGTRELIKLKKIGAKNLKLAFTYLLRLRSLFEAEKKASELKGPYNDKMFEEEFLSFLCENIKDYPSTNFRNIVEKVLTIAALKGIPLTRKNITYLWMRASM